MNPFWWLLWALCAIVVAFIASAVYVVVRDGLKPKPCPRCGYQDGTEDTYVPDTWTK